jgi:hypothetical protein
VWAVYKDKMPFLSSKIGQQYNFIFASGGIIKNYDLINVNFFGLKVAVGLYNNLIY